MIWWIYLLGYLFFYRYTVGALVNEVTGGCPYSEDWVMGCIFGALATLLWPVYVPIWVLRQLSVRYVPAGMIKPERIFPSPSRPKTQAERARERQQRAEDQLHQEREEFRRLQAERAAAITRMRRAINARELELGWELSTWED